MIPLVDEHRFDDDAAFAAGVGRTDVVKRPTSNARQLRRAEFDHGRQLLADKLHAVKPTVVIVTFREAAERLLGKGTVPGVTLAGADVFVMPGPYQRRAAATPLLDELAAGAIRRSSSLAGLWLLGDRPVGLEAGACVVANPRLVSRCALEAGPGQRAFVTRPEPLVASKDVILRPRPSARATSGWQHRCSATY